MSLNLALDSGGTKVAAILYDEHCHPISACTVGSMRTGTTPKALVEKNIKELISNLNLKGKTISNIVGLYYPALLNALESECIVENARIYREGNIGMFAAGIPGDGYLITVGTGSSLYGRYVGNEYVGGGYGALISDEGSGYWIAREGFKAAIKDFEQRGTKTILGELISKKIGGNSDDFHRTVLSICDRENINYVTYIASFAPLVTEAAYKGDTVALDILLRAGKSLGEQLIFLSNKHNLPKDLPIAISGNAWKGHNAILNEFSETIRKSGLSGDICFPVFEPVVGAVLCYYHNNIKKLEVSDIEDFLKIYDEYRIV